MLADLLASFKSKAWRPYDRLAMALLILWLMCCVAYAVYMGVVNMTSLGLFSVLIHLAAIVPMLVVLLLCWRWPIIGSGAAILVSLVLILGLGFEHIAVILLIELPPLLAGMLIAVSWVKFSDELSISS